MNLYLAKVVGSVVSTSKDPGLTGTKLLIVQKITENLIPVGNVEVAVDSVGAGSGEIVIISKGSSARNALNKVNSPIDAAIVGIVDTVEVNV